MIRNKIRETVLYYTPGNSAHVAKLKGVLVRMGIRIKNVSPDQVMETVGGLLGLPGRGIPGAALPDAASSEATVPGEVPVIPDEMLVMHNFSGSRLDELLLNLRKAGVPKIDLKAIVTESNAAWTFYHLYKEIKEEHEKMQENEHEAE